MTRPGAGVLSGWGRPGPRGAPVRGGWARASFESERGEARQRD